jgi:hypothetical protein
MAANRIGKNRQGYRPEASEAGKGLFFLRSCGPLLLLDGFQGADGSDDVARLGLLATGDRGRWAGLPFFLWFVGWRKRLVCWSW